MPFQLCGRSRAGMFVAATTIAVGESDLREHRTGTFWSGAAAIVCCWRFEFASESRRERFRRLSRCHRRFFCLFLAFPACGGTEQEQFGSRVSLFIVVRFSFCGRTKRKYVNIHTLFFVGCLTGDDVVVVVGVSWCGRTEREHFGRGVLSQVAIVRCLALQDCARIRTGTLS